MGDDRWMMRLERINGIGRKKDSLKDFKARLYYRGGVPTKENHKVLSQKAIRQEESLGFETKGIYKKRMTHFVRGLAIGSEDFVTEHLLRMRDTGQYLRRKNQSDKRIILIFIYGVRDCQLDLLQVMFTFPNKVATS